MARNSEYIFAGTVAISREVPDYFTQFVFRDVRFIKGPVSDSVNLLLLGNTLLHVDGQPGFRLGARYIVFALDLGSWKNSFSPVLNFGQFRVAPDPSTNRQIVYNCLGNPLVRFSADQAVELWPDSHFRSQIRDRLVKEHRETAKNRSDELKHAPWLTLWEFEDPGTRVSEDEFLDVIEGILRERQTEPATPKTR